MFLRTKKPIIKLCHTSESPLKKLYFCLKPLQCI